MKLVKESLNEVISFERKKDPLTALGIGKRKLIEDWLKETIDEKGFVKSIINDNLTINCHGNIFTLEKPIIIFPEYIQFNEIYGNFNCTDNKLISLRGCPKFVNGDFDCAGNQLTSLEGCPEKVEKDFYCENNKKVFSIKYIKSLCKVGRRIYNVY